MKLENFNGVRKLMNNIKELEEHIIDLTREETSIDPEIWILENEMRDVKIDLNKEEFEYLKTKLLQRLINELESYIKEVEKL